MEQLMVFDFEDHEIRTVVIKNEVWFVGKDVAEILGYERTTKAIRDHVDDEDIDEVPIQDSIGRMQITPIINESGLYSLVLKSQLAGVKRFKRHVTSVILPSIRKHGAYMTPETIERSLSDPDFIIGLATKLKSEQLKRKELEAINSMLIVENKTMAPKAEYLDRILKSPSLVTITQIAKDYGMSGISMNRILHELGVQYKQSDQWLLYYQHHDKGYTSSETIVIEDVPGFEKVVMQTKWTQAGRKFLYNLLKDNGILPRIETINT